MGKPIKNKVLLRLGEMWIDVFGGTLPQISGKQYVVFSNATNQLYIVDSHALTFIQRPNNKVIVYIGEL